MKLSLRHFLSMAFVIVSLASLGLLNSASAATAADLDKDAKQALQLLYKTHPTAKTMGRNAKGILIFPNIVKAGLVFGGSYGEGELLVGNKVENYYNSVSGSWGLQIGAQSYSYVVFLMNDKALKYLRETKGWEFGAGPTIVLVDEGVAKNLSTTTMKDDAYGFVFGQQGLMAGLSLEGTKISPIKR